MFRLRTRSMSEQRVFARIISSVSTVMLQAAAAYPLQSRPVLPDGGRPAGFL